MTRRSYGAAFALALGIGAAQAQAQPRQTTTDRMASAASQFLATLTPEQRELAASTVDDQQSRTSWNYLPESMAKRSGIPLTELTTPQRDAVHAMLVAALSSQGYGKLTHIMWLEEVLRASETAQLQDSTLTGEARRNRAAFVRGRDPGKYWIVLFGQPGSPSWGWTFSGHHFAVNLTVVGGKVAFTPMFLGANPQTVRAGEYAGVRTLQHEIDKAFTLAASLDPGQRKAAVVSATVPPAIIADKGKKGQVTAFEGIRADKLDPGQRALLRALIDEFLGDASGEAAAAQRARIEADGFDKLHFAWWGPADDPVQRFMYRIHGPSILIELVRERTTDGGPANHIHAIVRDPRNDYGEGWLGQHYREHHQP